MKKILVLIYVYYVFAVKQGRAIDSYINVRKENNKKTCWFCEIIF